jgi:hypothetical protein
MAKILCFLGFHDWLVGKQVIVKEGDFYYRETLYKCATCCREKSKREEMSGPWL